MQTLSEDEFLGWAAPHGIAITPEYAEAWPRNLSFTRPGSESRFWCIPGEASVVPWFLDVLLEALGGWRHACFWPKDACWLKRLATSDYTPGRYVASTLKPVWDCGGAIKFNRKEIDTLATLMFCAACFGEGVYDDVYIVPDTLDVFLMIDHHEVIWAKFASRGRCTQYVEALRRQDIELPTEPPDETFKPLPWM